MFAFSQEQETEEEETEGDILAATSSVLSDAERQQIIMQIREEVFGTSVNSSKLVVIPLIQEHSAISTLVAQNIFDGLEARNTSEDVEIHYNNGIDRTIIRFDKIIEEASVDENYNIMIVVHVISETVAERKQDSVYGVEVNVYNDAKEPMYEFTFEDTLENFFSATNTDRYQVEKLASLVQDYWDNKGFSILQVKSLEGPLSEYRIELDGETLETVSSVSGYAYFSTGNHRIRIFQIIPPEKEGEEPEEKLKLTFRSTPEYETYVQEIDFSIKEPRGPVEQVLLIEKPFALDLQGGVDVPLIFEKTEDILSYNLFANLQFKYSFNKLWKLPIYVGIMLKYNIFDNIDQQLYKATNYDSTLNTSTEGIRTMIGLFSDVGAAYQMNNFMIMYAGITAGYLIYSPSSTDTTPYPQPFTIGTTLPAFGINLGFSEHLNSGLYVVEQISLLFTDYRWVNNYILTIPSEDETISLIYKSEISEPLFALISSISVGLGYRF